MNFVRTMRQLLCNHNNRVPEEHNDREERNRIVSELEKGESITFSRLHKCKKCGKEKMIGSGRIF